MQPPMQTQTFKIIMVGDGGVGKTTFLKRHDEKGDFEEKYNPTLGVDTIHLTFHTTAGPVCLNIWDCGGQFRGLEAGYYVAARAAIVMFDVTSQMSYDNALMWIVKIRQVDPNIPIVLCGNKIDGDYGKRIVQPKDIYLHKTENCLAYYDVSAKSNYNFEKPFLKIIRHLIGPETRFFIGAGLGVV
jgi:GTP-binding nuclear protein Ran